MAGQFADAAQAAPDHLPLDVRGDLVGGLVQRDGTETDEPVRMCGERGVEFAQRTLITN